MNNTGAALADPQTVWQALRASEALVDSLLAASGDAIALIDGDGIVRRVNAGGEALGTALGTALLASDGHAPDIGRPFVELWPEEQRVTVGAALDAARRGDVGRVTASGPVRAFDLVIMPVRPGAGPVCQLVAVAHDASERVHASAAQEQLDREVSHRIRNLFALISGLTRLSAHDDPAVRPFAEALCERFGALSRAFDHVRPSARGAADSETESLHGLLRALLAPYDGGDGNNPFTICGDDVGLPANAVTSLALIVHELATGALARGVLAAGTAISIASRIVAGEMEMIWSEQGGVAGMCDEVPPGFSSVLIERSIRQLRGTIIHRATAEGREVTLRLPLANAP
jgi:two-component sensor histidine kinase